LASRATEAASGDMYLITVFSYLHLAVTVHNHAPILLKAFPANSTGGMNKADFKFYAFS